jgi:WD40 repeat protein
VTVKFVFVCTDAVRCLRLALLGLLLLVGCNSESETSSAKFLIGSQFDQTLIVDGSGAILQSIDLPTIEAKWSPDGKQIAFRSQEYEVGVLNLETGETTHLWHSEASDLLPRLGWSPDGRHVAYVDDDQDSQSRIYVFDLGEESITRADWPCGASCGSPVWQPDNINIVYVESLLHTADRQDFFSRVNQLNTQSGITTTLFSPNHDTQVIRWSPDGQQMALLSRNYGVFIRDSSGTERRLPVSGMFDLCWLSDGEHLALTSFYPSSGNLYVEAYQLPTGVSNRIYPLESSQLNITRTVAIVFDCR